MRQPRSGIFGTFLAIFGSILIGIGIFWLIAQNWHQLTATIKIIILLVAISASYVIGTLLEHKGYPRIGKVLYFLGALLYTASIFLIAQIFATATTIQGTAWLFLLSWIGVIAAAYLFNSRISITLGLIEFIIWLILQYFAFNENYTTTPVAILGLILLAAGVLLYGLHLIHRTQGHTFASIYQWWTIFYFLAFSYILSFQLFIPELWRDYELIFAPATYFLTVFVILAITILSLGLTQARTAKKILPKEIQWFIIAILALFAFIIASAALPKDYTNDFFYFFGGGTGALPLSIWIFWIIANIILLGVILGVVGYGTWQRQSSIINIGIAFFSLDVITRYIGFIMDLRGYLSLSLIFISGGILLIVGGWFIEQWRRRLVTATRKK
ncbi:MAG: DUF2157 domain-containing protein [Nanoarchaeota archaeon]|nr:DUF2157 domain-containing protein [Nanoarchaeota archaeon]